DEGMHQVAHPGVIAGLSLEPKLLAQDELQWAVVQLVELRVRHPHVVVERLIRPGPVSLEPPRLWPDADREEAPQGGDPRWGGDPAVGQRPTPERNGLGPGQWLAIGDTRHRLPRDPPLRDEPGTRRRDGFLPVGIARRE